MYNDNFDLLDDVLCIFFFLLLHRSYCFVNFHIKGLKTLEALLITLKCAGRDYVVDVNTSLALWNSCVPN